MKTKAIIEKNPDIACENAKRFPIEANEIGEKFFSIFLNLLFLINLAGFPPQISLSGISLVTTLPAPTITFFPNVVPFRMMEFAPRKQPSPITIGRFFTLSSCSIGYR